MGFFDAFRQKEQPFPEKGIYKDVAYRIDGDAVMVKASTGREMDFSPSPETSPTAFDSVRKATEEGFTQSNLLVSETEPPEMMTEHYKDNATTINKSNEDIARDFGISVREYDFLEETANEIISRYWRSRARFSKKG